MTLKALEKSSAELGASAEAVAAGITEKNGRHGYHVSEVPYGMQHKHWSRWQASIYLPPYL